MFYIVRYTMNWIFLSLLNKDVRIHCQKSVWKGHGASNS
jgi:hypothetical protein